LALHEAGWRFPEVAMRNTLFFGAALIVGVAWSAEAETLRVQVGSAEVGSDPATAQPVITLLLKPESKAALSDFTRVRVGQQITVRVGTTPVSAPFILEPILEGRILISGQMTTEAARELVDLISASDGVIEIDGADK
jgi:preprotein translocase subunit SecD